MSEVVERTVSVWGGECRISEAGEGPRLGVMAGHGGLPRWTPFLSELAERRRVVVVSLPGFPGSGNQHETIDGHLDWLCATLDLLEAADLEGCDLAASSTAAMLAADVAAYAPGFVRRLSLAGPYGLFNVAEPVTDFFANAPKEMVALLCKHAGRYAEAFAEPSEFLELAEWRLQALRAQAASARIAWPMGERGLVKRLHRIRCPVQLLWGREDRLVPPAYADVFSEGLGGPTETVIVDDAGHLVWVDQPERSAREVLRFLEQGAVAGRAAALASV
jgi:pimeloyl-ACP methyl ester carboxylesterase